jgi:crossover junction endodeoxyribonuclease RuvC
MKIILGIDPGLASTGFGVIRQDGNRFRHVAHGVITTSSQEPMGDRLVRLHRGIDEIVRTYAPHEAAAPYPWLRPGE